MLFGVSIHVYSWTSMKLDSLKLLNLPNIPLSYWQGSMSDLSKPYVVQVWYREIYKRPRTTELEVLNDGVGKPLRKK